MNCKDFENMIHELVSRRAADQTKQLEALEHAGRCLRCARRLDEENKLSERLRAFAGSLQGQRAPLRVEAELLQGFRERNWQEAAPLWGPAWRRFGRGWSWGLALSAIVATSWLVIVLWPRFHRGAGAVPSQAVISPAAVDSGALQANGTTGSSPAAALKRGAPSRAAHGANSAGSALGEPAREMTTDFLSLGTCDDSQCLEEATLVRVALPAEALLAFGLEMDNEYAPDAWVQADVALGSNGVPFAIRFVN